MRRTFFSETCLFMILSSCTAAAQTEKGDWLIGTTVGGASYANSTNTTTFPGDTTVDEQNADSYSISVGPRVGWFVKDNLALGSSVSVSYFKSKAEGSTDDIVTGSNTLTAPSVLLGPFARCYFGGSASAKPFVEAGFSFIFAPSKAVFSTGGAVSNEARATTKGYGAGLTVGYEHFVNKTVGVVFSSGVNYFYREVETEQAGFGGFTETTTAKVWVVPFNVGLEIHL